MDGRPPRAPEGRLLPALVGAGVVAVVVLLASRWIAARNEIAAARGHEAAIAQAAAHPGTLVTDPALPAGVVEVDLVPALPDLSPLQPATIHVGAVSRPWSAGAPARFESLRDLRGVTISVAGPCAAAPAAFDPPAGTHGARIDVRTIPVDPPRPPVPSPETSDPQKVLEVDMTLPGALRLRWSVGHILVSDVAVPRASGAPADPALAERLRGEWKVNGWHLSSRDRELDQATVRVAPTVRFDEVLPVVAALLATRREIESRDGEARTVPVFRVSVQPSLLVPR